MYRSRNRYIDRRHKGAIFRPIVSIDCAQVVRSDVVMDLGAPINPTIDIGQVEGAFTQGKTVVDRVVDGRNDIIKDKG